MGTVKFHYHRRSNYKANDKKKLIFLFLLCFVVEMDCLPESKTAPSSTTTTTTTPEPSTLSPITSSPSFITTATSTTIPTPISEKEDDTENEINSK